MEEEWVPDQESCPGEYGYGCAEESMHETGYEQGGGGGCFSGQTHVAAERAGLPISRVKAGDVVWGYDPIERIRKQQRVLKVWRSRQKPILSLSVGPEEIACTAGQEFFTGVWTPAARLRKEDQVMRGDGGWQRISADPRPAGRADIWNLQVAPSKTYFVGRSELLVHNKSSREASGEWPWDDDEWE